MNLIPLQILIARTTVGVFEMFRKEDLEVQKLQTEETHRLIDKFRKHFPVPKIEVALCEQRN